MGAWLIEGPESCTARPRMPTSAFYHQGGFRAAYAAGGSEMCTSGYECGDYQGKNAREWMTSQSQCGDTSSVLVMMCAMSVTWPTPRIQALEVLSDDAALGWRTGASICLSERSRGQWAGKRTDPDR